MRILTKLSFGMAAKSACLVILLAFMPNLFTYAQVPTPDPCVPDCPSDQWGSEQTVVLGNWTYKGIPVNCEVEVTYVTRQACAANYNDLQILKVEVMDGRGCPFAIDNQTAAIQALHKKLIAEDAPGFGLPSEGNCSSNWRISNGSCWQFIEIESENIFFVPCEPIDACCLTRYEVCRNECGDLTIEKQNTIGSGDCEGKEGCDLVCQ